MGIGVRFVGLYFVLYFGRGGDGEEGGTFLDGGFEEGIVDFSILCLRIE